MLTIFTDNFHKYDSGIIISRHLHFDDTFSAFRENVCNET